MKKIPNFEEAAQVEMEVLKEVEKEITKEDKAKKFKKLSAKRLNNAADAIRVVSNLANKSDYDYTEEEVDEMFAYLREAVDRAESAFKKEFIRKFEWK